MPPRGCRQTGGFVKGGYVMIHILRGRRTWLDTSPALREAGEVSHNAPSPASLFALSRARLPSTGQRGLD